MSLIPCGRHYGQCLSRATEKWPKTWARTVPDLQPHVCSFRTGQACFHLREAHSQVGGPQLSRAVLGAVVVCMCSCTCRAVRYEELYRPSKKGLLTSTVLLGRLSCAVGRPSAAWRGAEL